MFRKIFYLISVLTLLFIPYAFSHADSYDDRATIEHATKQFTDYDNSRMDAARDRLNQQESYSSSHSNSGASGLVCIFALGIIGWFVILKPILKANEIKNIKENLKRNAEILRKKATPLGWNIDIEERKCIKCFESIKLQALTCKHCNQAYAPDYIDEAIIKSASNFIQSVENVNTDQENTINE